MRNKCEPIVLERPSLATFREAVREGVPVKLLRVIEDWPIVKLLHAFDNDFDRLNALSALWGEIEVAFGTKPKPTKPEDEDVVVFAEGTWHAVGQRHQLGSLSEFCDLMMRDLAGMGANEYYYADSNAVDGLGGAVHSVPIIEGMHITNDHLWMGNGARTHLHYDSSYNLINMILGHKRLILAPPGYFEELVHLPNHITSNSINFSLVDFLHSQKSEDTKAALDSVPLYDITLGPGESLYLPPLWWHQVESTGINMAVQGWARAYDSRVEMHSGLLFDDLVPFTGYQGWCDALLEENPADPPNSESLPKALLENLSKFRTFLHELPDDNMGHSNAYVQKFVHGLLSYYCSDNFRTRFADHLETMCAHPGEWPDEIPLVETESAVTPFPKPDVSKWQDAQCQEKDGRIVVTGAPPDLVMGHVIHWQNVDYRVAYLSDDEEGGPRVALGIPLQPTV